MKRKRLRVIAVILIVVALAVYLILDMNVEKADYSDSLQDQIKTAQELLSAQRNNAGNEKGQYAQYTLLAFERQIKSAEQISKSEDLSLIHIWTKVRSSLLKVLQKLASSSQEWGIKTGIRCFTDCRR